MIKKSYDGARKDLLSLHVQGFNSQKILDIGCYRGANAVFIKKKFQNVRYIGLELDPEAVHNRYPEVDEIFTVDLEMFEPDLLAKEAPFDVIIMADVLEHLKNPEVFLVKIRKLMNEKTRILVSIPNIQFYWTFILLLFGRFPRKERGLFDGTHLRWFTHREFKKMIKKTFCIERFRRTFRLIEPPGIVNKIGLIFLPVFWIFAPFFTFQMRFLLRLR